MYQNNSVLGGTAGQDCAARIPEIASEMARLDKCIESLLGTARQLGDRLNQVMRPEAKNPASLPLAGAPPMGVPLATGIANQRGSIEGIEALLADLLARIEV
jgi:hypothetical protein